MLCLGLLKSLSSPRLKLTAQGMAQHTNVQSQLWYHSAKPKVFRTDDSVKIEAQSCARATFLKWQTFSSPKSKVWSEEGQNLDNFISSQTGHEGALFIQNKSNSSTGLFFVYFQKNTE